jgi:hypothetical protein
VRAWGVLLHGSDGGRIAQVRSRGDTAQLACGRGDRFPTLGCP